MKNYNAFEFKDLNPDIQETVKNKFIDDRINFELDILANDLNENIITEAEYYNTLGCSKYYAESTGWFVPSAFYQKHKKHIDDIVKDELKQSIFTKTGEVIEYSFIDK